MSAISRLTTAIVEGVLDVPQGAITLMRPPTGYDVSELPRDNLSISHSFFPDAKAWEASGYVVTRDPTAAEIAIVVLPRAKALARGMIAAAARIAPIVVVDGAKTDGIDSLYKECRKRLGALPSVTKAHGRLFWMRPGDTLADWTATPPAKGPHGFFTAAGVYSDGAVDKGSAALVAALPSKLPARIADLGAGWGYLSDAILQKDGVKSVDLIEAEALALDCARLNVTDPRATFHWGDVMQFKADKGFDAVVMNPPFHAGRAAEPALGRDFIQAARRLLAPHGKLWMVANRHLPYEATLQECFRNVDEVGGNAAFKVFLATRPLR